MKYILLCQYCGEEVERELKTRKATCFLCKKERMKFINAKRTYQNRKLS